MLEVTDIFTALMWLLLCTNVVVVGFAALVEFKPDIGNSAERSVMPHIRHDRVALRLSRTKRQNSKERLD